jgi:hypothetical protein
MGQEPKENNAAASTGYNRIWTGGSRVAGR